VIRPLITVVVALAVIGGCAPVERGTHLINRSAVPLALGFADVVPPCTERFLTHAEANDVTREPARAWSPAVAWIVEEGVDVVWMVVSDDATAVHFEPPAELPPCGGVPPDWLPPG
jgi:hypothetical protein